MKFYIFVLVAISLVFAFCVYIVTAFKQLKTAKGVLGNTNMYLIIRSSVVSSSLWIVASYIFVAYFLIQYLLFR